MRVPPSRVGTPPDQWTRTTSLMRLRVRSTVTDKPENAPVPVLVSADDASVAACADCEEVGITSRTTAAPMSKAPKAAVPRRVPDVTVWRPRGVTNRLEC